MRTLITVLNSISETSMPYNEFVLYRLEHMPDLRQVLVVCGKPNRKIQTPPELEVHFTGLNPFRLRKVLAAQIRRCEREKSEWAVHLHQLRAGLLAQIVMLGTAFGRKSVFSVHSTYSGYSAYNKLQSYLNGRMAQYVVCVSSASLNAYPESVKRQKGGRVLAIRNGVDSERIDRICAQQPVKKSEKTEFVYVARMIPIKNHDFLLDVIAGSDADAHFTLIGAEDAQGKIRERIRSEHLEDRVRLTGMIPRNEVFRELQNADVYVSPSTLEGMPVSVLEAMYAGLPAVLSDIPQHREAAEAEGIQNFARTLPLDKTLWIETVNALTRMEKAELAELGRAARAYTGANFSLAAMHAAYDTIYEKLFEQR